MSNSIPSPTRATPGSQPVHSRGPTSTPAPSMEVGADRWLTDRIVTVYVGPEEKRWAVHEKLLSSRSRYFNHVFNGSPDGTPGSDELKMPKEDPKLFGLLIRWLYGTAFATSGGARVFRFSPPDGKDVTVRDYLGLYILAETLTIIPVKNAAIDCLYDYFKLGLDDPSVEARCPDLRDVRYIFDHTPPESPMRKLLIVHAMLYLFSKKRRAVPRTILLPDEWEETITQSGDIGWAMIKMLSEWKWTMGSGGNVPEMKIKHRQEFHEVVPVMLEGLGEVKAESVE
ncbi:hypothetical protein QBC46DRAFT_420037 [Diplogelasinospora grovesii]|uniref:BTB domain-containing protein n=1 Tax=Diplogelasinospora grovesii TaxID=303347 RepID=A0AAN6S854_9PEZI|nr:hypothetical protein QBC46DRAFT_420037 [Diplogelasinospora grovesii]